MKISIQQLDLELEKLYQEAMKIDPNDQEKIEAHTLLVENFVEACGFDLDSYIRHMMGFDINDSFN